MAQMKLIRKRRNGYALLFSASICLTVLLSAVFMLEAVFVFGAISAISLLLLVRQSRYWFIANGREYRGYVAYSSDEALPSLDEGETRSERIRYIPVFPYINKPAMLSEFDEMGEGAIIYHILAPLGCLFLLRLVIRSTRGGKKKKTEVRKPAAKSAAYREPQVIESRGDTGIFCHNCGNKLPEGAGFCSNCGAKIQASAPSVCKACGTKLPDGAEFCIGCGSAVNRSVPEPAESRQATAYASQPAGLSQAAPSAPTQAGLVGFSDRCYSPEILAAAF